MVMNKQEIADIINQFDASLEEAQYNLETLRKLAETEVPNVFRGVGLSFDVFDIVIYPSRYLLKVAFGIEDAEIYTVSFRDGIIDIWFKDASAKMFMYEIDLNKQTLKLWEYAILLLILADKKFQEKLQEHIGAVSVINSSLVGIMRFLSAYKSQNSED